VKKNLQENRFPHGLIVLGVIRIYPLENDGY